MKKLTIAFLTFLSTQILFCQTDQYLGLNLNQLPATSLDLNYQIDLLPFISFATEAGFTLNYQKNFDLFGYLLSSHCTCSEQYDIDITNGGHIKIGTFLNLRKTNKKFSYFNIGLFFNQAIVHQKGKYNFIHPNYVENGDNNCEQTVFVSGFSSYIGYNLKIYKKLSTNIGFQVSFTSDKPREIFGYSKYIPGMGLNDYDSIFPMLIINLSYKIK